MAEVIVTTHAPVPVQAPPQPAKLEPFVGVAASVTRLPASKAASQNEELELQPMPGGELVTLPVPVPPIVTTSKKLTGGAPLAATPGEGCVATARVAIAENTMVLAMAVRRRRPHRDRDLIVMTSLVLCQAPKRTRAAE
jgi:hypothetical protein